MSGPFNGPPTRADMLLVAKLALAQINGDLTTAGQALTAIGPGQILLYRQCYQLAPSIVVGVMASCLNVISVEGTGTGLQWVGNLLGQGLYPSFAGTGRVSAWFQALALLAYARLKGVLANGCPNVFVGHSLGAGMAELLAAYAANDGYPVQGIYVLGSPKPGNAAFVASLPPCWSWYTWDDPVGSLPPFNPAGWVLGWPYSFLDDVIDYAVAGQQSTIAVDGSIRPGYTQWSVPAVLLLLSSGSSGTHTPPFYVNFLRRGLAPADLVPGANGYAAPWVLADQQPPPGGADAVPYGWTQPTIMEYVECDGSIIQPPISVPPKPLGIGKRLYGPPAPEPSQCVCAVAGQ